MAWSDWIGGIGGSSSKSKSSSKGGVKTTHHLSTAGKGGSKRNHSHTIVRESGGRKTAHAVPHKDNRKNDNSPGHTNPGDFIWIIKD
jgi:hypothetical protein